MREWETFLVHLLDGKMSLLLLKKISASSLNLREDLPEKTGPFPRVAVRRTHFLGVLKAPKIVDCRQKLKKNYFSHFLRVYVSNFGREH